MQGRNDSNSLLIIITQLQLITVVMFSMYLSTYENSVSHIAYIGAVLGVIYVVMSGAFYIRAGIIDDGKINIFGQGSFIFTITTAMIVLYYKAHVITTCAVVVATTIVGMRYENMSQT